MITLNVPLITWCVIAFAMVTLIIVRVSHKPHHSSMHHHHAHLFEIGSEREEFFIPGDRIVNDDTAYDDEI